MVKLRQGRSSDWQEIRELLAAHQFGTELDPTECLVAEENGQVVGLARLELNGEDAYLRPIAVSLKARGRTIGRALIARLSLTSPRINVVARGEAVRFYQQMGFTPEGWAWVPMPYKQECELCPDFPQCGPVPMRRITEIDRSKKGLRRARSANKEELL